MLLLLVSRFCVLAHCKDGTLYLWGRTSETDEMLHLLRVMQDGIVCFVEHFGKYFKNQ